MSRGATIASPDPRAAGVAAGISEPMVRDLVHTFYERVRLPLHQPTFDRCRLAKEQRGGGSSMHAIKFGSYVHG